MVILVPWHSNQEKDFSQIQVADRRNNLKFSVVPKYGGENTN